MTTATTTTDATKPTAAATPTPPATGAPAKVWAALLAHPGATTAEIAAEANISSSTASKTLAALETDDLITRTPGSGKGRGRTPDTWAARAPEPDDAETEDDTEPDGTETDGTVATGTEPGHADAEDDDTVLAERGQATAPEDTASAPDPGQTSDHQAAEDQTADELAADEQEAEPEEPGSQPAATGKPAPALPGEEATATDESAPASPGAEAEAGAPAETETAAADGQPTPKGGLRVKVAAWLAEHLDRDVTPGRLGKILGHSSGAVANALDTLVRNGEAVQTGEKPYRYAHPDAKVETTDTAPRPPRVRKRPTSGGRGRSRTTAAGLTARAVAAATQRHSLDAEHPTQPGWGTYAQAAAATLAHLLGIGVDQIDLGSEPRSADEAWVRLSITDPTATITDVDADGVGKAADNDAGKKTPDTHDEPTDGAESGETAQVGDGKDSTADGSGVPPNVTGGAFVFTAPFGHPARILAISACPDCAGLVPTTLVGHLADLGALIAPGSDGSSDGGGGDPAPTPVPEIRAHPTHDPSCPHANGTA